MNKRGILAGALLLASPVAAQAPDLFFPLDCTLGTSCFIQQFVDRETGPGARDYTCGPLTYDTHKGTDIRLKNRRAMLRGVDVLAAAGGMVVGVRDGEADIAQDDPDSPDITGRECGNGVVLRHSDGWTTQYCHMRQGSVRVAKGSHIKSGTPLGQVGLSGQTEFPHLHIVVRQDGAVIDPFAPIDASCGGTGDQMWIDDIPYMAGGILDTGFASSLPPYKQVRAGLAPVPVMAPDSPAIVNWTMAYGLQKDDTISIRIFRPDGSMLVEGVHIMPRDRAQEYRAVGKKRPRSGWPTGQYRAVIEIQRRGQMLDRTEVLLSIKRP